MLLAGKRVVYALKMECLKAPGVKVFAKMLRNKNKIEGWIYLKASRNWPLQGIRIFEMHYFIG
jgi:hypothetical protein